LFGRKSRIAHEAEGLLWTYRAPSLQTGGLDCLSCSGQSFVIRGTIEFETPIGVHIRALGIRRSATSAYAASTKFHLDI
jgi:hypothetical protein